MRRAYRCSQRELDRPAMTRTTQRRGRRTSQRRRTVPCQAGCLHEPRRPPRRPRHVEVLGATSDSRRALLLDFPDLPTPQVSAARGNWSTDVRSSSRRRLLPAARPRSGEARAGHRDRSVQPRRGAEEDRGCSGQYRGRGDRRVVEKRVPKYVPNSADLTAKNADQRTRTPLNRAKPSANAPTLNPKVEGSSPSRPTFRFSAAIGRETAIDPASFRRGCR